MADNDSNDATAGDPEAVVPPVRPEIAATSVPREKPLIEGEAHEIVREGPSGADAAETASTAHVAAESPFGHEVPPANPWEPILPDPQAEVAANASADAVPPAVNAAVPESADAPRGGGLLWPVLVAIVFGALAGAAVTYGLSMLDATPAKLRAVDARVAALEQRPDAATALSGVHAQVASLDKRLSALEATNQGTQAATAALRTDLNKLSAQKPGEPSASVPGAAPDLAPLDARIAALEAKVTALSAKFNAVDTKFNGVDSKVGALATKLDAQKSQVRATEDRVTQSAAAQADSEAVAILAANLLRKVETGVPYTDDLSALASRGIDKTKLLPLQSTASDGVAPPAALARQFSAFSDAILASAPAPKDDGFLDHLVQGATRLVRVRKIGDTSGDDLAARVARIQASLDTGAIDKAYQQWRALPAQAQAKSHTFGDAAKRRLDALAAARAIDAEAMAALGKAKS